MKEKRVGKGVKEKWFKRAWERKGWKGEVKEKGLKRGEREMV